jgi:hypothetical protein
VCLGSDQRKAHGEKREHLLTGLHRQKKSQWRDVHWRAWLGREALYRTMQLLACHQYSSGNMRIVAERSASVSIHIVSPALVVYADRMRNPCSTERSFSCLSASGTSPQSPLTCRSRKTSGVCSAFSKARSAQGLPLHVRREIVSSVLLCLLILCRYASHVVGASSSQRWAYSTARLVKIPKRTHLMELTVSAAGMLASLTPENRPTVCRHADRGPRGSAHHR